MLYVWDRPYLTLLNIRNSHMFLALFYGQSVYYVVCFYVAYLFFGNFLFHIIMHCVLKLNSYLKLQRFDNISNDSKWQRENHRKWANEYRTVKTWSCIVCQKLTNEHVAAVERGVQTFLQQLQLAGRFDLMNYVDLYKSVDLSCRWQLSYAADKTKWLTATTYIQNQKTRLVG